MTRPVIMITAYISEQGRQEARELDVLKYFEKPLDTDDMLTAVHSALHGDSVVIMPTSDGSASTPISNNVIKRLDTLKTDTGSLQLMLATKEGDVIYSSGTQRLDLPPLAKIIARNINDSFALAEKLGTKEPFSLQYHAGEQIELYCANIGESHFLTLFFDTSARRGRIGTIWVFTQRAISDLQVMLTIETPVEASLIEEPVTPPFVQTVPQPDSKVEPAPLPNRIKPSQIEEPAPLPTLQLEQIEASESELAALFSTDGDNVDLDSFWDDATFSDDTASAKTGMTLEEAKKKGLFNNEPDDEK